MIDGGSQLARVLKAQGVRFLFTLCGGHISPILIAAKREGIRVIDVRDEANAVFAADSVARLTGIPGVAAVTAGPGITNTITALKNAQLAQSPVVLLGGATGTILKGRGSLQDIDQEALISSHVKWMGSATRVSGLAPLLEEAFQRSLEGVPGPVFVECPVDLLYDEQIVRGMYGQKSSQTGEKSFGARALHWYLQHHVDRLFRGGRRPSEFVPARLERMVPESGALRRVAGLLAKARQPILMVGSQATANAANVPQLVEAVEALEIPTYLSGMARGLLGKNHSLHLRHHRRVALRDADLVILAGVPCDFRLEYGRQISARAVLVSFNRNAADLIMNRRPTVGLEADPALCLSMLSERTKDPRSQMESWLAELKARDSQRTRSISETAGEVTEYVNPLAFLQVLDDFLTDDSVLVTDGGDFVATAAYTLSPRTPLSWLDPGVFGTLGVGGGFALGAKLARDEAEVWIIYGDGSAAYSLAEFDTFVRHKISVIAVVGNDASWAQIAREQVDLLHDDVGTVLRRTDYHVVAEGYGGRGILVESADQVKPALLEARRLAAEGSPVLINLLIGKTSFRKGSISM